MGTRRFWKSPELETAEGTVSSDRHLLSSMELKLQFLAHAVL
jgi:hypothetical protein